MKIIHLSQYVYIENLKGYKKNKSGLGIMIYDIVSSLAKNKNNDIRLLTHSGFNSGLECDNFELVKKTKFDIIKMIDFKILTKWFKYIFRKDLYFKQKIYFFGYLLVGKYCEEIINSYKPDIIHIHGISLSTKVFIDYCLENNLKFVLTLHGLNGLNDDVSASHYDKKYESDIIRTLLAKDINISVISSGIKERIEDNYLNRSASNIKVILNGVEESSLGEQHYSIREKYGIPENSKIIITVGNVSTNKNQLQVIRAFKKLPKKMKRETYLLIIGMDEQRLITEDLIKNENIIVCGFVKRNHLANYYFLADIHISASKDEGFGLPLIEAMIYGVPNIAFPDIDAFKDIYNSNCFEIPKSRDDDDLMEAILRGLNKNWDSKSIMTHSKKFTIDNVAHDYMELYNEMLK